jgi:hypothetical protein
MAHHLKNSAYRLPSVGNLGDNYVYQTLCDKAVGKDGEHGYVEITAAQLAADTKASVRTVEGSIRRLLALDPPRVELLARGGRGGVSRYRILVQPARAAGYVPPVQPARSVIQPARSVIQPARIADPTPTASTTSTRATARGSRPSPEVAIRPGEVVCALDVPMPTAEGRERARQRKRAEIAEAVEQGLCDLATLERFDRNGW